MRRFRLVDGVEQNALHPDTFEIPSEERKAKLKNGEYVKLGFKLRKEHAPMTVERMWVKIVNHCDDDFLGEIDNNPVFVRAKIGEKVFFNAKHILSTLE